MGNVFRKGKGTPPVDVLESLDLEGIAKHLLRAKNVIVLVGAGASTSCGIPDFRTPGTGLYDNLQKYNIPRPEAIFDLDYFRDNPEPFYELVQELWPGRYRPSLSHSFLKLLDERGVLLRCYSQNIDSLETAAGLPAERLVAAHGNFDGCRATGNGARVPLEEFKEALSQGRPGWEELRRKYKGLVKPDIVFFGESLPAEFFRLQKQDFPACDLLIVMGTSLAVRPFSDLVGQVSDNCPRLLINREEVGLAEEDVWLDLPSPKARRVPRGFHFGMPRNGTDVFLQGDCDEGVSRLAERCGWLEDLQKLHASS